MPRCRLVVSESGDVGDDLPDQMSGQVAGHLTGRAEGGSAGVRVLLIGKPGCHLCDDAREVVAGICADLGMGWREESIIDNPRWAARYADFIPVVIVDGVEHAMWRVDPDGLRRALAGSADGSSGESPKGIR